MSHRQEMRTPDSTALVGAIRRAALALVTGLALISVGACDGKAPAKDPSKTEADTAKPETPETPKPETPETPETPKPETPEPPVPEPPPAT